MLILIQYNKVCFQLNHFEDEDHGLNLSKIENIITLSEIYNLSENIVSRIIKDVYCKEYISFTV